MRFWEDACGCMVVETNVRRGKNDVALDSRAVGWRLRPAQESTNAGHLTMSTKSVLRGVMMFPYLEVKALVRLTIVVARLSRLSRGRLEGRIVDDGFGVWIWEADGVGGCGTGSEHQGGTSFAELRCTHMRYLCSCCLAFS